MTEAADARRALHIRESTRVDLAEELGVTLVLLARVLGDSGRAALRAEVIGVLKPFEQAGTITAKGTAVLNWARQ